jgi:Fe2+ or Zn2+ uptake regulation protein
MRTPEDLSRRFRERGLKVTPQRELIFRLVHGNQAHPTAEAIYAEASQAMPTMSRKTVYQTLHDLTEMGELLQLDFGTGSSRFDPNVGDHHHLVCTACGKVRDVFATFADLDIPSGDRQGFELGEAEVVFRGRCAACQAAAGQTALESAP